MYISLTPHASSLRALTPPPSFASGGEGKLSTLPPELFDTPTLTELNLPCSSRSTKISRPPKDVQEQGAEAMRRWWAENPPEGRSDDGFDEHDDDRVLAPEEVKAGRRADREGSCWTACWRSRS